MCISVYRENILCTQVNIYMGEAVTYNPIWMYLFLHTFIKRHKEIITMNHSSLSRLEYNNIWEKASAKRRFTFELTMETLGFAGVLSMVQAVARGFDVFSMKRSTSLRHLTLWRLPSGYMYLYVLTLAFGHNGDCCLNSGDKWKP